MHGGSGGLHLLRRRVGVGQRVSIATVRQDGHGDAATLVLVTHSAPDAALSATVEALQEMPAVRGVTSVLRVEGLS